MSFADPSKGHTLLVSILIWPRSHIQDNDRGNLYCDDCSMYAHISQVWRDIPTSVEVICQHRVDRRDHTNRILNFITVQLPPCLSKSFKIHRALGTCLSINWHLEGVSHVAPLNIPLQWKVDRLSSFNISSCSHCSFWLAFGQRDQYGSN